ncbi:MAG: YitT family protein [Clostridium sp.]|uniref:YitT family protein n=1 Tax=Clostridium TaxID=1485 RepID=UPI0021539900|nr:YitT family protein [Clostridium sp. LY3-2]MCR6513909.1 YitT family protein [Clostridium sp. LY3-2]
MNKKVLKEYSLITFGIILVAISVEYFFAPNELAAGGVTGLAIVVDDFFPGVGVGTITLIINAVLFVAAFLFIDGNFGGKTIYASLILSVVMWIIEKWFNPYAITTDLIIATIFGTLISAIGMAIVFNNNASTGGTDILAKMMNKFIHLDIGKSLLIVDFVITLAGAYVFGLDKGFYSMLSVIILGISVDKIIEGFNTSKQVMIISNTPDAVNKFIIEELERSSTFIKGFGGYKKEDNYIIYTILNRNEFIKLKNHIRSVDPRAFITVGEVHEVLGEGFKDINKD